MDTFVQRVNIVRFKEMLLAEDNPARLKTLHYLLAAEEADLVSLEKTGNLLRRLGQASPLSPATGRSLR
jgi:hypothetical protein